MQITDRLGDEEIQVGIPLAMRVTGQIDGHAVHFCGEVGAVIEVERPKKILVGFAFAGVLGDD